MLQRTKRLANSARPGLKTQPNAMGQMPVGPMREMLVLGRCSRRRCPPFYSDLTLQRSNNAPQARLRGILVLLLANKRQLFSFDYRAIDRDFSDVFAARHVIHDIKHDALEHRAQRTCPCAFGHGLGC
jgi:hypothetical protein